MYEKLGSANKSFLRKWATVALAILVGVGLGTSLYLRLFIDHHTRVANDKAASVIGAQLSEALKTPKSELEKHRCAGDMLNRDRIFCKPRGIKASEVGIVTPPTELLTAENASEAARQRGKSPAELPYPLVPSELIRQIDQRGPRQVVRELFDRDEEWANILRNVARGEPEWLELAARLHEGSDAHSSEELVEAVRSALTESPEHVLELSRKSFPLTEVCCKPAFDVDAGRLDQEIADLYRQIRALDRVNRADLAGAREKCKELIRQSIREIRQSYGKTRAQ